MADGTSTGWQSLADALPGLFASGRIAELILFVMLVEGVVLLVLARRGSSRLVPVAANLTSGACLVLALRAALVDAAWPHVAVWLGLSFAAHAADLVARLLPAAADAPSPVAPSSRRAGG
jgi:hypothetical protein